MQKPTVGRIVIYREGDAEQEVHRDIPVQVGGRYPGVNGTREHPAVITRVWSESCINLHVLFDAHEARPRCSVMMLPDLPEGVENTSGSCGWRWPDRAPQ